MTALDPTSADWALEAPAEPFSSLAWGPTTLTPTGTIPHPVEEVDGLSVIPRDTDKPDVSYITGDASGSPSGDYVVAYALVGLEDVTSYWQLGTGAWAQLVFMPDQEIATAQSSSDVSLISGTTPYDGPTPSGLEVWLISGNGVESRLYARGRGTIATAGPVGMLYPTPLPLNASSGAGGIAAVFMWEGVVATETDLADTADAVYEYLTGGGGEVKVPLDGEGLVALTGSAHAVSVDSLPTPPLPPELVPGGSQDAPPAPPFVVPDNVPDPVIRRVSRAYASPSLTAGGWPEDWTHVSEVAGPYARLQVVVEGVDITWLNGVPTPLPDWSLVEPFGSYSATIRLPQVSIFTAPPTWARNGANVELNIVRVADGSVLRVFTGAVVKVGRREDDQEFALTCHGVMFLADLQKRLPSFSTSPGDIGTLVAEALNSAVSRRYDAVEPVVTGCLTAVSGGWEPRLSGYVQSLLATAITDGRQWTVACTHRSPAIVLKDTTTQHWTVRAGQPGVLVELEDDAAESHNVIYGEGIRADGGHWRNAMYPNWRDDETPQYPFTDAGRTVTVGTTDAITDTGDGVSVWQARVNQPVTGFFSVADRDALRALQRAAGIQVDGILGPQSWASSFNTGANTGTLDGAWIAPLAAAPEVMPRLYGPDGSDAGANPLYDPDVIRVERKINYGQGVTLAEARANAEEVLARDAGPGWAGTIGFALDPVEGSKFEILPGQNIGVQGWEGQNPLLHISAVDVRPEETYAVRLTVDSKARDYPTLDAVRYRERDAVDPARIALRRLTESQVQSDRVTYDAESPAGRLPDHAIFSNLWDVRQIPLGAYGTVVRSMFRTYNPARAFSMAVFGRPITAARLLALVGNPLTTTSNESPYDLAADALREYAFMQAWGWREQPAGYHPRAKSNPAGDTSAPVTGRLEDDSSFTYASEMVPWVWVATIASGSCYVGGRFYVGAQ